ncbi:MAG: mechanosensitive ion channel domain-containing protein [Bacteroidia bacterium]
MEFLEKNLIAVADLLRVYGLRIIIALLVLVAGLWIIKGIRRVTGKVLHKRNVDISLHPFLLTLVSVGLKVLLFISVAAMIGIETTSFIAVIGAAGLAVGLALQGSLANFAGGVLILLLKPFRVGDFIDGAGKSGTVQEILIFYTILKSPDNRTIIVPNGKLSNDVITNFSVEANRRLDLTFGIGYGDDIPKAKEVIRQIITADERILTAPEPVIVVSELGDSAVNITIKVWVERGEYWPLNYDLQENVKLAFDKDKISIPFPQRDIHMYTSNGDGSSGKN